MHELPPEAIVRRGIFQVMEGRRVFEDLTVEENIDMGGYTRNDRAGLRRRQGDAATSYFPRLKERRKKLAGYLSGGEQQMLAISRALMARPKLMLLDEPSLGLAPLLVAEIFRIIKRINEERKTTILLVEQNANLALSIADYGYIMENGRVVLDGEPEKLRSNEDVKEFYLGGGGESGKKSYKNLKFYKRRKRWLSASLQAARPHGRRSPRGYRVPTLRPSRILDPAVECQSPEDRRVHQGERLRRTVAHAFARAPRARRALDGRRPRPDLHPRPRRPAPHPGDPQGLAARPPRPRSRPSPASPRSTPASWPASSCRPAPSTTRRAPTRTSGASATRSPPPASGAGDVAHNSASLPPDPARLHARRRRPGAGLRGHPRRRGADRAAGPGGATHVKATAYLGLPSFLHALAREGPRARARPSPSRRPSSSPRCSPSRLRAGDRGRLRGAGAAGVRHRRPRLPRLRVPGEGGLARPPRGHRRGARPRDRPAGRARGSPARWSARIFDVAYPLLRFGTGDLVARSARRSAAPAAGQRPSCWRPARARRRRGQGEGDVRPRPARSTASLKRFPEVTRWQAVVTRDEPPRPARVRGGALRARRRRRAGCARLADALREEVKVKGEVRAVVAGTIPQGAKRIDDRRVWK